MPRTAAASAASVRSEGGSRRTRRTALPRPAEHHVRRWRTIRGASLWYRVVSHHQSAAWRGPISASGSTMPCGCSLRRWQLRPIEPTQPEESGSRASKPAFRAGAAVRVVLCLLPVHHHSKRRSRASLPSPRTVSALAGRSVRSAGSSLLAAGDGQIGLAYLDHTNSS
jgi:hypothetical protein